jgi:hypothetical protein
VGAALTSSSSLTKTDWIRRFTLTEAEIQELANCLLCRIPQIITAQLADDAVVTVDQIDANLIKPFRLDYLPRSICGSVFIGCIADPRYTNIPEFKAMVKSTLSDAPGIPLVRVIWINQYEFSSPLKNFSQSTPNKYFIMAETANSIYVLKNPPPMVFLDYCTEESGGSMVEVAKQISREQFLQKFGGGAAAASTRPVYR